MFFKHHIIIGVAEEYKYFLSRKAAVDCSWGFYIAECYTYSQSIHFKGHLENHYTEDEFNANYIQD